MNNNIAIIFAGGVGKRMGNTELPKQFIKVADKPIIIHTLEIFDNNPNIDSIIISSVGDWIDYLKELLKEYNIKKVADVVPGGSTGQMSIFNGIKRAKELYGDDSIVLIHDGVRPFIDDDLINRNIECVRKNGSSISSVLATETFTIIDENCNIISIPERAKSLIGKAPQSFYLKNIYDAHIKAQSEGKYEFIDSCTLMNYYKYPLTTVLTDYDNIKITTPKDIPLAESIYQRRLENNGGKECTIMK